MQPGRAIERAGAVERPRRRGNRAVGSGGGISRAVERGQLMRDQPRAASVPGDVRPARRAQRLDHGQPVSELAPERAE